MCRCFAITTFKGGEAGVADGVVPMSRLPGSLDRSMRVVADASTAEDVWIYSRGRASRLLKYGRYDSMLFLLQVCEVKGKSAMRLTIRRATAIESLTQHTSLSSPRKIYCHSNHMPKQDLRLRVI